MRFGSAPIRPLAAAILLAVAGMSQSTGASAATCAGLHAGIVADGLSRCISRGVAELEAAVSIVDELFADHGRTGDRPVPYIYEGGRYDPGLGVVFFHRFDRKTTTYFTPRTDALPVAFLPEERLALFADAGRGIPLSAQALGVGGGGGGGSAPNVAGLIGGGAGSPGGGSSGGGSSGGGGSNPTAPSGGTPDCESPDCGTAGPDTPTTSPVGADDTPLPVPLPGSLWLALAAVTGLGGLVWARRA